MIYGKGLIMNTIYAFNFAAKQTEFSINEFKDMKFIAVDYQVPQSRTMLKLDPDTSMEDIVIAKGSLKFIMSSTKAAIEMKEPMILINDNRNMNTSLMKTSTENQDYTIAYIMIDKSIYRMVDYCRTNQFFDSTKVCPEIRKEVVTKEKNIAVVQFDLYIAFLLYCIMILYNNIMKRYEYYQITVNKKHDGLICENLTFKLSNKDLKAWADFDKKNNFNYERFMLGFNRPVTRAYITLDDDNDTYCQELMNMLEEKSPHLLNPIIFRYNPSYSDEDKEDSLNQIKEEMEKYKINCLTWYKLDEPFNIPGIRIRYNFIMDETGVVRMV